MSECPNCVALLERLKAAEAAMIVRIMTVTWSELMRDLRMTLPSS